MLILAKVTAVSQICALFLFLSDKCLTYGVLEYMWETLVFSVGSRANADEG